MKANSIINTVFNNPDNRVEMDFYPTPPDVTEALYSFLMEKDIKLGVIHEPACGAGDISKVLLQHGYTVLSTDIRPTGFGNGGMDYLVNNFGYTCDSVITNPPFSLAEEFIRKAMGHRVVCMLLKANYFHAAKRVALFKEHTPAFVLPLTWRPNWMFKTQKSSSPTMDVSWYVWIKGVSSCTYLPITKIKTTGKEAGEDETNT